MIEPFILPEKSHVLEIAESIGNTMLAPAIGDAEEAEQLLTQLIDECYRQRDEIERLSGIVERRNATYTKPNEGFVCFHCGERFLTYESAKEHFGEGPDSLKAEIERLQTENAALKKRLEIDDAMVERAG